jgi:hypothetical protein
MKHRYLTAYIDPKTGRERLGIGADAQLFHYYANPKNVIRYGLTKEVFPAGQYSLYAWPEGTTKPEFLMHAYKRV